MIERQAIRVDCPAATPEEAIREAGNALCRAGACSPQYVRAMVDSYRELGPYFVIAPGWRCRMPARSRGDESADQRGQAA